MFVFNNVTKKYKEKVAVDNISFDIQKNDFIALIRNNGCGKTTTINVMSNILTYSSGELFYKNKRIDYKYHDYKNELGIILSSPYYIEEFTVEEYLKFVAKFQFVEKTKISQRIEDILNLLEFENEKNQQIKKLSSGSQMKVSIGSALIHNPEMLILDEPFINLDIRTVDKVMSILKSFKNKKTIFITSHNLELVKELCDRFLIMDKGKIITDIHKKNFKSLQELENAIKKELLQNNETQELDWLN